MVANKLYQSSSNFAENFRFKVQARDSIMLMAFENYTSKKFGQPNIEV